MPSSLRRGSNSTASSGFPLLPPKPRERSGDESDSTDGASYPPGPAYARTAGAKGKGRQLEAPVVGLGPDLDWGWLADGAGSRKQSRDDVMRRPSTDLGWSASSLHSNRPASLASFKLHQSTNPLSPLRKRLARSLDVSLHKGRASGASDAANLQLQILFELLEALEQLIACFSQFSRKSSSAGQSLDGDDLYPPDRDRDLLRNEVLSLVKELIEADASVEILLSNGLYGPISSSCGGGDDSASVDEFDRGHVQGENWWVRRLRNDTRAVLDELSFGLSARRGSPSLGEFTGFTASPTTSFQDTYHPNDTFHERIDRRRSSVRIDSTKVLSSARTEELLEEGRIRWATYERKRRTGERYG